MEMLPSIADRRRRREFGALELELSARSLRREPETCKLMDTL